jgi:hypothetical protein
MQLELERAAASEAYIRAATEIAATQATEQKLNIAEAEVSTYKYIRVVLVLYSPRCVSSTDPQAFGINS